ncbi:MAG: hypothetical protein QOK49_4141, partial [Baekduia sp.]|nr:hypothetical protein [Baekduia sp.]
VVADPAPLQATMRAARAAGAIDELIARAVAERARALDAAGHATARMRPAPESASALAALPVPDGATIERVLGAVVEAAQTAAGLETEDEAIADRVRALEHQRDRLVVDARVPDAAALVAARARRAAAWAAARAELVEPTDRTEAEAHALAEAVEGTTADADATADARLAHAEEVARLADLERELSVLSHDADELSLRRERHETTVAQAAEAWQTAWAETGPVAPAPEGAAAWLAARKTALGHLADAEDAAERLAGAEAVRDQHADALRGALADAGAAAPAGRVPLATLLELADARAETLRAEADRHDHAGETVGRTAAEADDAEAALARAEAAAARWDADWTGLRDGCGLAPTLAADDALGALRRLAQAAQIQDEHARVTGELEAIDARRAAFTSAVAELLREAAPDLADQPAATAVSVLHRRATEARAAAAERDALAAELTTLEAEQAEAGAIAAEAEEQLAVLRAAAGAADDAALVRCEQVSAQAEALRAEILQLDGDLARAGGAPADEVAAAVTELDADAAPARAEALDALAAARRDARDQAGEALLRARDELAALERSEDAAVARQESATLLAQVRQTAERYARARLAQKLLRDAIERYRSDHEGPLLARANVLFPALTCERFAQLKTELDEHDEHVLVAVTRDGARRRVEELSDGTREQLFLALRLAAIERHVAASGPVPVLFDDVLLESDDDRAMRILDALADLAGQTQVIVLTHHRHLVDLARCTIAAERLDLLELDERASLEAESEAFGHTGVTTGGEAEDAGVLDEDAPDEREPRATPTLADELAALTAGGGRPPAPGEQSSLL